MATELVGRSRKEIDRLYVIRRVAERRKTQVKAARLLGLARDGRAVARSLRMLSTAVPGVATAWESVQRRALAPSL